MSDTKDISVSHNFMNCFRGFLHLESSETLEDVIDKT